MRPDQIPSPHQLDSVRDELHRIVDQAVDFWLDAIRMTRDMGRGYAGSSIGAGGGSGGATSSVVERAALDTTADPAVWAAEWLAEWHELRGAAHRVEKRRVRLLPDDPHRGRPNTIELCTDCGIAATSDIKRIDGQPYHPDCYTRTLARQRQRRSRDRLRNAGRDTQGAA